MSTGLAGVTGSAIEYALDGLSLRQAAIASNIANVHSAAYRPLQVNFERSLAEAVSGENLTSSSVDPIVGLPRPRITHQATVSQLGAPASLESQAVLLNQNVLQYHALVTGLNKYMSSISIAVNEGRK